MARTSTPAPARGPQRRRHGDGPGSRGRCPGGGRQPRSGRPGRPVGRTRRGDRRGDRRARRDQHHCRSAGPARAREGRRAPATRLGALRDLVEDHLRKFPDAAFTPHQVGKVLTRSAGAVANALDKLVSLGTAQMIIDKPCSYRLAPAAPAPGPDAASRPGTSTEAAPSAA
jgi:hypothetical protein